MAGLIIPLFEAGEEYLAASAVSGAATAGAGAVDAAAGAGAVAGAGAAAGMGGGAALLLIPGDTTKDKAKTETQTSTRTRERECKCPPEKGRKMRLNHAMNPEPRRYQARITGYEYGIEKDENGNETSTGWNMEWAWLGVNFDGFVQAECLLQEAKGNYDQLIDKFYDNGRPVYNFSGFSSTIKQIYRQGALIKENPPSKLTWYFETHKFQALMNPHLEEMNIQSVYTG